MILKLSGQKGFQLIEVILALCVTAIIMTIVVNFVFFEVRGTTIAKVSVSASQELGNAGRSLRKDVMMAQSSDLDIESTPADNLTLSWIEWYKLSAIPHVSTYWLSGNDLKRDYDGVVTIVARNISSISFSQNGRMITVLITTTPPFVPTETVEQAFNVWLRPLE